MGDLNYDCSSNQNLTAQNAIFCLEALFDMQQIVKTPTRITLKTNSLLDIILTTDCEQHSNTCVIDVSMSDHCCVYTEYNTTINFAKQCHNEIKFRDYKHFNAEAFKKDLDECEFISNAVFEDAELVKRWSLFLLSFLEISAKHVPCKRMRLKDRCNPWISNDTIDMMKRRDHLKSLAVKNKDDLLWKQYKELRNSITKKIKIDKKNYYKEKLDECGRNPKKVWKLINKITNRNNHVSPPSELNADVFNDYFSTIGEKIIEKNCREPNDLPWKQPPCSFNFAFTPVSEEWVKQALMKLSYDSNIDVLGCDCKLLRMSSDIISPI
jgi:hypothetical protein